MGGPFVEALEINLHYRHKSHDKSMGLAAESVCGKI
jgi:hypothetical protein